jgi:hypothetical protein
LRTPWAIRQGARTAAAKKITGYLPSLEPFSYVMPREEFGTKLAGKRVKPLGFDWLPDGQMPLRELPAQLQRFAYREFSRDPNLSETDFRKMAGTKFFGKPDATQKIDDLFFLQEITNWDRRWSSSSPAIQPELFKARSVNERWPAERIAAYQRMRDRAGEIAERYRVSEGAAEKQMRKIARFIVEAWQQSNDRGK